MHAETNATVCHKHDFFCSLYRVYATSTVMSNITTNSSSNDIIQKNMLFSDDVLKMSHGPDHFKTFFDAELQFLHSISGKILYHLIVDEININT
jgi:hypothetical protein